MPEQIKRHLFLTIWLFLIAIVNLSLGSYYLFKADAIQQLTPAAPLWVIKLQSVFMLFNFICAVALFYWKKWGFWGFCATGVIACFVNILFYGVHILFAVTTCFVSILLLFVALNVGKERKAWPKLT